LRRLSISFTQEIIWLEVGMLWDASNLDLRFSRLPKKTQHNAILIINNGAEKIPSWSCNVT